MAATGAAAPDVDAPDTGDDEDGEAIVVEQGEVTLLEVGNVVAVLVGDGEDEVDFVDADLDGGGLVGGLIAGLLRGGRGGRR